MILAAAILATVLAPPSTLCMGGNCRPVDDSTRVRVAPEESIRPFVWISADACHVVAGIVPAGIGEVLLAEETLTAHQVTVSPSDGGRNIASAFELRCGGSEWTWSLARLPKSPIRLMHPGANCTLSVRADDYKSSDAALTTSNARIALRRLPVISGSVIAAITRTPIAGAEIFLPDGELLITTDAAGRFRVPLARPWPSRLRVDAVGHASAMVEVPKVVADVDLPIVRSAGGSIAVTLAPPLGKEPVRWEARRIIKDVNDEKVRSGEIAAGQSSVTIERLDAGSYRLLLLGEGPLQRVAIPINVTVGTTVETTIEIQPARLELEVVRGGEAFGGAEVEFVFRDGEASWRANVSVDAEGRKETEIWQRGDYLAGVSSWTESRRLDGDERIAWKLEVPDRIIRGLVVDARTGQVLANVPVSLESTSEGNASLRSTRSAADGSYEFRTVRAGSYSLSVSMDGYEDLRTPHAALSQETVVEKRDLRMQIASGPIVRVVNASAMPMPSVLVYVATSNGVRLAGVTKDDGSLALPIGAEEGGVVYVVPRSGSFGMARFASASETGSEDIVITVADANASLEIHAVSDEGEPIRGMSCLMRVDGILLPPEIKEALVQYQGWPLSSDVAGRLLLSRIPPGRYEVWPLASRADFLAVASGTPPPAPVSMTLTPGAHLAQLTFKPKS